MMQVLIDLAEVCALAFLLYVVNKLCDHAVKTDALLRERGIKKY